MMRAPVLPEDLVLRYSGPVPRYTSYPPANYFSADFPEATYAAWLGGVPAQAPVSVYVHLPFCASLCWYCGCNMKVSNKPAAMASYMADLDREMTLLAARLPQRLPLKYMHLGGGTPTHIDPHLLRQMMTRLRDLFTFTPGAEIAIEIDPRTLTLEKAQALAACGINRASLGVQDTNAVVQQAINRVQPFSQVAQCVEGLRHVGINHLNLDLIYGLPLQTEDTITQTVAEALTLQPQRIALFGYAHVPQMKKHQKLLERHPLPDAIARYRLFCRAADALTQAGYLQVGLDHFVRPTDSLAHAQAQGTLHRNFQGYTPDDCGVLLGLGVSAISQLPQGYVQNTTSLKDYATSLALEQLPLARGHSLSYADMERRSLVMSLMCRHEVVVPQPLLVGALPALQPFILDGIATLDGQHLRLTPQGRVLVRQVAACFDSYSRQSQKIHAQVV